VTAGWHGLAPVLGADVMERWRDIGPVLWLAAAGLAGLWFLALGLMTVRLRPNRVAAGPGTLDLPGEEPPAVVNLITSAWELGHEAIAATLLDLAGRGHLAIDSLGGRTTVRLAKPPGHGTSLPVHDEMVFTHVATLARRTDDGVVPAEALTTGPDARSKSWWRRFEGAVVRDARTRGLSRPRWPARVKAAFVLAALPVAAALGMAVTALDTDQVEESLSSAFPTTTAPAETPTPTGPGEGTTPPTAGAAGAAGTNDDESDDEHGTGDIIGAGIVVAVLAGAALSGLVGKLGGERDTPAGREEAARWLGVREMLGDNPVFAEQPAAGVAIWDKHLGHGAALGVAHGAVRDLPLGTESDTEAWSHVGGRWRVVRIRYPRRFRPGWGAPPSLVTLWAVVLLAAGGAVLHYLGRGVDALRDQATTATSTDGLLPWIEGAEPYVRAIAVAALVVGGWFAVLGVGDLVRRPRVVAGHLVRHRLRGKIRRTDNGTKDDRVWFLAVDDGTTDRIRAWRMRRDPAVHQGADVQVTTTPVLGYVRDVLVRRAQN
jgi:hypothetical protein